MNVSTRPLCIAFLGIEANTAPLFEAVIGRHVLAGTCEIDPESLSELPDEAASLLGRAKRLDSWEALLDPQAFDAVIVSRDADEDRRAEQLRKLIQAGMPLIVSHPVLDSMLLYYELDMIRRDTNCIVVPYLPTRNHPAIRELADMVDGADSVIGKVGQVTLARSMAQLDKSSVVAQFSRDVDVIRAVAGEMTRLGAMAGTVGDAAYSSLGVQMSGPANVAARWSIEPGQARICKISLFGERGTATFVLDGEQEAAVVFDLHGQQQVQDFAPWDPAAAALDELESAIGGVVGSPDWVDAARDVELAETIERSLSKGRTIELYYEDYTEEGTFKGTMTSLGCGLLLLGMVALGAVAIAEQMGVPFVKKWPYALLGLFGLFLVLQFLLLIFRKPASSSSGRLTSSERTGPDD